MRKLNLSTKTISIIIIFVIMTTYHNSPAQDIGNNNKIIIGEKKILHSSMLNEERTISIYLPRGYNQSENKYPVLYLLDGDAHFHHATGIVSFLSGQAIIPQLIVVAISNIDRNRDFTPTKHKTDTTGFFITSGGADNFLMFINNELIPFIDQNYRTERYRILFGHSLGGLLTAYTLFSQPEMFDACIAVGSSLYWDSRLVLRMADKMLSKNKSFKKFLFFTIGNESSGIMASNQGLLSLLENKAPNDFEWGFQHYTDDNHGSAPHQSIYDGLRKLYSNWRIPENIVGTNYEALGGHYRMLSEKYGYVIDVPEFILNLHGYRLLGQNKIEEAIETFKINVKKYPNSSNVYDSLGEAYERNGQLDLALNNYQTAVQKGMEKSNPNLQIYKKNLDRVKEKLSE